MTVCQLFAINASCRPVSIIRRRNGYAVRTASNSDAVSSIVRIVVVANSSAISRLDLWCRHATFLARTEGAISSQRLFVPALAEVDILGGAETAVRNLRQTGRDDCVGF